MLEVFDVTLPAEALLKLKAASEQPDSAVYFATSEEIMNGMTNDGAEIPSAAQALLAPQPTIEEFQ